MYTQEFKGINSFLVGIARLLLKSGVSRITRSFETIELDQPIIVKISNPLARLVTIPERNWNHILPYAESLWISSGRNDIDMIGAYVKKMFEFSDDQISMRAAYGPRLRYFTGASKDYQNNISSKSSAKDVDKIVQVDQFLFVEQVFKKDPFTRQAIISITDPAKDYFDENNLLKKTKDFPCTNNIQFLRRKNSLDVIVNMRSNDFFWGASAVNIFNFTLIQEYFAAILGLEVGSYYHIVNNLHYYKEFHERIITLASIDDYEDEFYVYKKQFNDLASFDTNISKLEKFEDDLRHSRTKQLISFDDDFFNDWTKVLFSFYEKHQTINFANPILTKLHERRSFKITN
jgi:thymidylate synthase